MTFLCYEDILICPRIRDARHQSCSASTQSSQTRHARPKRTDFMGEKQIRIRQSPLNPPDCATTISRLITNGMNGRQISANQYPHNPLIHCAFKRALSKKWTLLWRLSLGDDVVNNLGPLWCSVRVVDDMPRGRTKSGRGPDPARGPRLARGCVRTYDKDIWPVLSRCGWYISSFVVYICGHHYLFLGLFSTNVFWVNTWRCLIWAQRSDTA